MSLESVRNGTFLAWRLMLAALVASGPAAAEAGTEQAAISREDFDRQRTRIAAEAAARHGESMAARLHIAELDREYVEGEVRKRMGQGQTEAQALDAVVGSGRAERIAKARRRLLEVHIPTEQDRERIRDNFVGVEDAMRGAGFVSASANIAVPFIESGYRPRAFNTAGRIGETVKGMWQLTESTARDHGLKVTKLGENDGAGDADERYDPAKSSVAAKAYLEVLEDRDYARGCAAAPELVLASYHMGQGNVDKKIAKYGCDFWTWRKDGEDGFGTHSYSYPALVLAGGQLLAEMDLSL